jgi:hypothetical protein
MALASWLTSLPRFLQTLTAALGQGFDTCPEHRPGAAAGAAAAVVVVVAVVVAAVVVVGDGVDNGVDEGKRYGKKILINKILPPKGIMKETPMGCLSN